jgi:hypothetical protein
LRQPTETFIARANEFNRGECGEGLPRVLAAVYDYCLSRNLREDETDESIVQIEHHKKSYIQSKHQVIASRASEKGYLMTAAASVSSPADSLPSPIILVFVPKNINRFFITGVAQRNNIT